MSRAECEAWVACAAVAYVLTGLHGSTAGRLVPSSIAGSGTAPLA